MLVLTLAVRLPHFVPTQALPLLFLPVISLDELVNLATESWQVFTHTKLTHPMSPCAAVSLPR
jgi:hypothetical protein